MITQETAQGISSVYDEIGSAKLAIELLSGGKELEISFINVATSGEDEGITVLLAREIAKEALEKQIKVLEAEYAALNEKAKEEADSNENSTE
jgi:hypothetical protein